MSNINYNEKGQRSDIHYGNGCKTRYEYDKNTFRLIRLFTNRNDNNNDENVLQDIHYTYDPVGNIVEIVDNAHQEKYFNNAVVEPKGKYEYDALYRLIKATGRELSSLQLPTHSDFANNIPVPNMGNNAMQNYTHEYSYDHLGNILQMKAVNNWTRNYVYDGATNRLLKHDNDQTLPDYTYDEHGNMLKMPHLQSMHYDYQDQLDKVVLDASENTAYYVYDANGQRVRKVIEKTGGIKEERYYLGNYEVYRKFVGITLETERTTVAVADDKRKIATIDKLTVDERSLINMPVAVIRYQYDNHLGSASLELDATAQIISYEEYHPFGTTSYRSGRSETEVSLKRYKYVGKERDEETGLYYYGFRYYAPWIARFINVDPLQHEYPHYTPFQYAGNKPITYVDLDGLEEDKVDSNTYSDFFDMKGKFIKRVNNRDILLKTGIYCVDNSIYVNGILLSRYQFPKDKQGMMAASSIITHYYNQLPSDVKQPIRNNMITIFNLGKPRYFNSFDDESIFGFEMSKMAGNAKRFYKPEHGGDANQIIMFMTNNSFSSKFDNYNNLLSGLIHENYHIIQNLTSEEYYRDSSIYELDAYYNQISDGSFEKTTSTFRNEIILNISDDINVVASENKTKALTYVRKMNAVLEQYGKFNFNKENNRYEFNFKKDFDTNNSN